MQLGAQLYTIRESCTTLQDFSESLKKIADIGYRTVQISGVCDHDPKWLKAELDKNGLKCVLTHTHEDKIKADVAAAAADHDILDCHYVGVGYYRFHPDTLEENFNSFIDTFAPVAKNLYDYGKYFMFHNHAAEFQKLGGRTLLDLMCEKIPAEHMGITLDVYWVQAGGANPVEMLEKLSGRVPCIHLKDYAYATAPRMAVVGEGNLNFERIIEKAESAGTKYLLVEQDECYGEDPFACLKRSYQNLKAMGLE